MLGIFCQFCFLNSRNGDVIFLHFMEKFINFTGDAVDVILQGIQVVAMVDERFGCGGGGGG